eukprot:1176160-Prorocentrum_minimum.AAC.3
MCTVASDMPTAITLLSSGSNASRVASGGTVAKVVITLQARMLKRDTCAAAVCRPPACAASDATSAYPRTVLRVYAKDMRSAAHAPQFFNFSSGGVGGRVEFRSSKRCRIMAK